MIGHWRRTYMLFDSARDENLVLRADGTAERWTATAGGTGARTKGVWKQTERQITVRWNDEAGTGGATSQSLRSRSRI